MASSPIPSWQIDGEIMETVRDFIFLGSKVTAGGDCSHEIKRRLLFEREAITNWDSILKSRDITLPTKVQLVKAMAFPVVMYACETWTIKKLTVEELMHLNCHVGEDLRLPWTARRSNTTVQKRQFFGAQLSLWSNSHIHTWLLEKPQLWLDGPLWAK